MRLKILYIDMDNVLVDFASAFEHLPEDAMAEHAGSLDDVPHIFSLMKPMPGALEAFEELSAAFDSYILSTAPWNNPTAWQDKLRWVHEYLGRTAHKRLILTHHKHLNRGDFLVDDREANGAAEFEGELIRFGSPAFPDWMAVKRYLLDRC